jgi:ketosteroid isomerase-like protein
MSQENVEAVRRAFDAFDRGDIEAVLEELDPEVEWHPLFQVLLGGEAAVYGGHEGFREFQRETNEAFAEQLQVELSELRDLGEQVIAIGRVRGRGRESGAQTETSVVWLIEARNGKAIRVHEYLDPKDALEAAGCGSRGSLI